MLCMAVLLDQCSSAYQFSSASDTLPSADIGLKEDKARQAAYADDLTGSGTIDGLKMWWDMVIEWGPFIGYTMPNQPNPGLS